MNHSFAALAFFTAATASTASAQIPKPNFVSEDFVIGSLQSRVVLQDVDGDAVIDLVEYDKIPYFLPTPLTVRRGDGFGRFAPPVHVATFNDARAFAFVDVDGDADLDLVAVEQNAGGIGTLLDVRLSIAPLTYVALPPQSTNETPAQFVAADLDVDGNQDLVFASLQGQSRVRFGDGAGGFGSASTLFLGGGPTRVIAHDVTGDALPDLVVSVYDGVQLFVNQGDRTFIGPTYLDLAPHQRDVAVSDLNGDGLGDLVALTGISLRVSLGTGQGFSGITAFPVTDAHRLELSDLDADGALDAVTGRWVATGDAAGGFSAPLPIPDSDAIQALAVTDFDGNGWLDVVGVRAPIVTVRRSVGPLAWQQPDSGPIFAPAGVTVSTRLRLGETNGDGIPDLVGAISDSQQSGWISALGDGAGSFSAPVTSPMSTFMGSITPADLNGDGLTDLVSPTQNGYVIAFAGGAGTFVEQPEVPVSSGGLARVLPFDIDGDGDVDLVVATCYSKTLSVFENVGGDLALKSTITHTDTLWNIADGDFDGDGDRDVVAVSANKLWPFVNDGAGGFQAAANGIQSVSYWSPDEVYAAHLDDDGREDVLVVCDKRFAIARGSSSGTLTTPELIPVTYPEFVTYPIPNTARLRDVDEDGRVDLVVSVKGAVWFFRGAGIAGLEPQRVFSGVGPNYFASLDVVDVDQDGAQDIVATSSLEETTSPISIFRDRCGSGAGIAGAGCPDSAGFVPHMTMEGCIASGGAANFIVSNAYGGAPAIVLIGAATAHVPLANGCFLELASILPANLAFVMPGSGAGTGGFVAPLAIPLVAGPFTAHLQLFVADPGVAFGFAASPRLTIAVQ